MSGRPDRVRLQHDDLLSRPQVDQEPRELETRSDSELQVKRALKLWKQGLYAGELRKNDRDNDIDTTKCEQ